MLWNPESEEIAAIMVRRFGKMVSTDIYNNAGVLCSFFKMYTTNG